MFQRCRNIWSWIFIEGALGLPCVRKACKLPPGTGVNSVSAVAKGWEPWWTSVARGASQGSVLGTGLLNVCTSDTDRAMRAPPAHLRWHQAEDAGTPLRDVQRAFDFSLESVKLRIERETKSCLKTSTGKLSFLNSRSVIWHGINACQRNL